MNDVTALGELLIDFAPYGKSKNGNPLFEQNAGGAPANVLAALSKLGKKTCFIGKVGHDQFGVFLKNALIGENITSSGLVFSKEIPTTLAFVHLDSTGDRSFSFYRNPGADMTLSKDEISMNLIEESKIFHFGSLSMTHEKVAQATLFAVKQAKKINKLISFDPNLRENLWESLSHAKQMISKGLEYADIVKVSEEELIFITGISDLENATEYLLKRYHIPFIFVTLGEHGCYYRHGNLTGVVSGFSVNVVDTTGAGDAFLGGILYKLLNANDLSSLSQSDLVEMVQFANGIGALATTKKGALSIMPTLDQIESLINTQRQIN